MYNNTFSRGIPRFLPSMFEGTVSYGSRRGYRMKQFNEEELKILYSHLCGSEELGIKAYHEQMALMKNVTVVGVSRCSTVYSLRPC